NEVTEVKHEAELLVVRRALVFENHASIRVLRSLVGVLTRDERKAHGTHVGFQRRRDRPADAASITARPQQVRPSRCPTIALRTEDDASTAVRCRSRDRLTPRLPDRRPGAHATRRWSASRSIVPTPWSRRGQPRLPGTIVE